MQIYLRAGSMKRAAGAGLYGPTLGKWPSRMVDAFTVLEREKTITDNAQSLAEQRDR